MPSFNSELRLSTFIIFFAVYLTACNPVELSEIETDPLRSEVEFAGAETTTLPDDGVFKHDCSLDILLAEDLDRNLAYNGFLVATSPFADENVLRRMYRGCICTKIGVVPAEGERLDRDTVLDATELRLNGSRISLIDATEDVFTRISRLESRQEEIYATAPESFAACWGQPVPLNMGLNTVEVIFNRANHEEQRHKWQFTLLD